MSTEDNKIYLNGNVHTASYHIAGEIRERAVNPQVITTYGNRTFHKKYGTIVHFNPNKVTNGHCKSLSQYLTILATGLRLMETEADPSLRRIDFKVDCNSSEEQMKRWEKLGVYAVLCFMAYKRPLDKNANIRHCLYTGRMQSAEAFTDGYKVRIYDKATQKNSEGVGRRVEFSRMPKDAISEREALRQLKSLLVTLPKYARQAQELCNNMILEVWQATMPDYGENRSINEFLRSRAEFIFTREQLTALYILLGKTPQQAATATKNFIQRHKRLLSIYDFSDIKLFCDIAIEFIDNYINGTSKTRIIQDQI